MSHMFAAAHAQTGGPFSRVFLAAPSPANSAVGAWIDAHPAAFPEYARLELPADWQRLLGGNASCGPALPLGPPPRQLKSPKAFAKFLAGFPLQQMSASGGWSGGCAARLLLRLAPLHALDSYTLSALLGLNASAFVSELLVESGVGWCTSNCADGLLSAVQERLRQARRSAPNGTHRQSRRSLTRYYY